MPEGDTLWRTAASLRPAILGQVVTGFRARDRQISDAAEVLHVQGSRVDEIDTRGKHLLIRFSGGATLRTHLQMTGSWHLYRPGSPWQKPERLAVVILETPRAVAVCFSAPTVELVSTASPDCLRSVEHIGPDILKPEFRVDEAVARLRQHDADEIAVALLNQSILAGIGNVYKSEVLFLCGVSPFRTVRELDDATLHRIVATAERQMRRNLTTDWRRTTASDARRRLWVYGAARQPCQRCGTLIQRRLQGDHGRVTFWCPTCQPGDA